MRSMPEGVRSMEGLGGWWTKDCSRTMSASLPRQTLRETRDLERNE